MNLRKISLIDVRMITKYNSQTGGEKDSAVSERKREGEGLREGRGGAKGGKWKVKEGGGDRKGRRWG